MSSLYSRLCAPLATVTLMVAALLLHGLIGQPSDYHHFADQRSWFGIVNGADVLSNLGFLVVGVYGLAQVWRARSAGLEVRARSWYGWFFFSLVLTAAGSSYYHLAPDNARLVWDRLPIAFGCASVLAAVLRDACRVSNAMLWTLVAAALASVLWWRYTDLSGVGDLRAYLLMQLLPLVLAPLIQWQSQARRAERLAFGVAITLYLLAKVCECADHAILNAVGVISGHTVKHLLAALAAAMLARSFARRLPPARRDGSVWPAPSSV